MTGRGLEGRRTARAMIYLAVAFGFLTLTLWMAQPGYMLPMFSAVPWYVPLLPIAGVASYFVGLGWMVRIYRAKPEPDIGNWRYRNR